MSRRSVAPLSKFIFLFSRLEQFFQQPQKAGAGKVDGYGRAPLAANPLQAPGQNRGQMTPTSGAGYPLDQNSMYSHPFQR